MYFVAERSYNEGETVYFFNSAGVNVTAVIFQPFDNATERNGATVRYLQFDVSLLFFILVCVFLHEFEKHLRVCVFLRSQSTLKTQVENLANVENVIPLQHGLGTQGTFMSFPVPTLHGLLFPS